MKARAAPIIKTLQSHIFLLLIAALLAACSAKSNQSPSNSKDHSYLYGVGEGLDIASAKGEALKDLITTLRVSVKVESQTAIFQEDKDLVDISNQKILLESSFRDLPSLEVDSIKQEKGRVTVTVKIEKRMLISHISQRRDKALAYIESSMKKCGYPAFQHHKAFVTNLRQIQSDDALIVSLSGINLHDPLPENYSYLALTKPSYKLELAALELPGAIKDEALRIVVGELNKFLTISREAKSTLKLSISYDKDFRIYLAFKDCNDDKEQSIQIDTYLKEADLKTTKGKTRLAALVYKKILETTKAKG